MRTAQRGFTYIGVLILVAIMGVLLSLAGRVWHTEAVRGREAQLLFVGDQYREAIRRYAEATPAGAARYPRALSDLLLDARKPEVERYLRRLYADPITGGSEWGLVKAPDGGIAGVYSLSDAKPLKQANFPPADAAFEGSGKYADWQFVYAPISGTAATPARPASN
ncbi:MAG: type II secretion system protein [Burkholderiales bacterium]